MITESSGTAGECRSGSISRPPAPVLRPFVSLLWSADVGTCSPPRAGAREHVLPTGGMHLVFRLTDAPLMLFSGAQDHHGYPVGHAIVGGARSTFYVRDISSPSRSIGAVLRPGACQELFGVDASELAGRHTPLDALWGGAVDEIHQQLAETACPAHRLSLFEAVLVRRVAAGSGVHSVVADAIGRFGRGASVRSVVARSGYSHRHFIELFRAASGLTPKSYCRVLRLQTVLRYIGMNPAAGWADVARATGYSDQAHLSRDFRAIAGMAPGTYSRIAPCSPNHVELPPTAR